MSAAAPETTTGAGRDRLDVLLYAHDGRGVGHAARSCAVALAVRRLAPHASVLLVTGSARVAELCGSAPLDWCKLPAYATRVVDGVSLGADGPSGISDAALGRMRAELLAGLVQATRPRVVLVDHQPQGKHRELLPALETSAAYDTRWVLGVRAVVGGVDKVWGQPAAELFRTRYSDLFWYGDAQVLGEDEPRRLAAHFGMEPRRMGYVSRLGELAAWGLLDGDVTDRLAGTAALSWAGPSARHTLMALAGALDCLGRHCGEWHVYADLTDDVHLTALARSLFAGLEHVRLRPFGAQYAASLARSRTALVFGGTNSLTDVLGLGLPAVVLTRGMQDAEQERHVRALEQAGAGIEHFAAEDVDAEGLAEALARSMERGRGPSPVDLDGAGRSAMRLLELAEVACARG